jgi:hypothetical protein
MSEGAMEQELSFDEYLDRLLLGAQAHKRNKMIQDERAKYRAADDICYKNSANIRKLKAKAKGK